MDSTDERHVQLSLGLYLLGALDATERVAVERHLAGCAACRAESEELAGVAAAMALLSPEEGRQIAEEFGPRPPPPPASGRPGPARPPGRPTGSTRPARSRPRRRTVGLLGIGGLALVVLVSAGIFVGLAVGPAGPATGPRPQVAISLAATADTTTGATLSVVAVGDPTGVTVRATVSGLPAGTRYQLYLVTSDGTSRVVATWAGSGAPRQVTGDAPVAVADLSFFTVARADGTPVVTAAVPR